MDYNFMLFVVCYAPLGLIAFLGIGQIIIDNRS